jgi:hypothetical protein
MVIERHEINIRYIIEIAMHQVTHAGDRFLGIQKNRVPA